MSSAVLLLVSVYLVRRMWSTNINVAIIIKERSQKVVNMSSYTMDKHGCSEWVGETLEENLKIISRYPTGIADKYVSEIGRNMTNSNKVMTSFPVIVTAADGNYFMASQGLIKSVDEKLRPKYKDIKVIYYDLGLSKDQRRQLEKHCNCEVRNFLFENFPAHIRVLKTYTWKPIIVKTVSMEYSWVWWCDTSVRFLDGNIDEALRYSLDNSMLFFTYANVFPTSYLTDNQTFEFLGEDRCKFRHLGQLEANFVLFYFDHVTRVIVDHWTSCALNEACMAPSGSLQKLACNLSVKIDGQCHRFDQSVLSILVRRVFHETGSYPLKGTFGDLYVLRRGEPVSYFPSQ